MVERSLCKRVVRGSNPRVSTFFIKKEKKKIMLGPGFEPPAYDDFKNVFPQCAYVRTPLIKPQNPFTKVYMTLKNVLKRFYSLRMCARTYRHSRTLFSTPTRMTLLGHVSYIRSTLPIP